MDALKMLVLMLCAAWASVTAAILLLIGVGLLVDGKRDRAAARDHEYLRWLEETHWYEKDKIVREQHPEDLWG